MSKGGLVGRYAIPNRISAKGIWNLREQSNLKSDNLWPIRDIYAVYNGYIFFDNDNLATSTWSNVDIGLSNETRRVVVLLSQRQATVGSSTASSVTVGGISASLLVSRNDDDRGHLDIWIATVPTGTTADIAVTWNNALGDGKLVAAYSLYGASATAYSTGSNRTLSGAAVSTTVNVITEGFVIAIAGSDDTGGGLTTTFTAGVDTEFDGIRLTRSAVGFGTKNITSTTTGYTVTADSTSVADLLLAVVSFQPL